MQDFREQKKKSGKHGTTKDYNNFSVTNLKEMVI